MSGLSAEDAAALRASAQDLSDIPEEQQRHIQAGFAAAYQRAQEIRDGLRNPLC